MKFSIGTYEKLKEVDEVQHWHIREINRARSSSVLAHNEKLIEVDEKFSIGTYEKLIELDEVQHWHIREINRAR